ncbi:MAG: hypothetical protein ACXVEF_32825 [Polyangiales bacterium]
MTGPVFTKQLDALGRIHPWVGAAETVRELVPPACLIAAGQTFDWRHAFYPMASYAVLLATTQFGSLTLQRCTTDPSPRKRPASALIGPNGCGTTLPFKALVGALPHEGAFAGWNERDSTLCRRSSTSSDLPSRALT